MSELSCFADQPVAGETRNRPYPPKIALWGENMLVVRVIPNAEYVTKGGIIVADTKRTQSKPSAGEIVTKSNKFDNQRFPGADIGSIVYYQMNSGYEFPDEWNGHEQFCLLDARSVVGCYEPISSPETDFGDE